MLKRLLITFVCTAPLFLQGCLWNDDFRSRVQPTHDIPEPKATFNEDSKYYVGDEVAKPGPQDDADLEAIDDLSEIPELPDKPTPSGY